MFSRNPRADEILSVIADISCREIYDCVDFFSDATAGLNPRIKSSRENSQNSRIRTLLIVADAGSDRYPSSSIMDWGRP